MGHRISIALIAAVLATSGCQVTRAVDVVTGKYDQKLEEKGSLLRKSKAFQQDLQQRLCTLQAQHEERERETRELRDALAKTQRMARKGGQRLREMRGQSNTDHKRLKEAESRLQGLTDQLKRMEASPETANQKDISRLMRELTEISEMPMGY